MSDIIHLLPDSIANQIAAGEVIQRPASVVKELVENAVDAGAGHIQVNIKDAGRTLVQVIDDGKGMSETDARMAFERHATSKISTADDLFSLHTMGFRGEALASIVAVSQVELRTRLKGAELGTHLVFSGSELESVEPDACTEGSIFSVKNLFFNVPARRKFLKSNETEFRNIINEFERIALVNSQVALSLYHNDTEIFNLPESGLRQRIVNVYGKTLNQKLLSVDAQSSLVTISGFVGRPDSAKKRGALQYFFVNGRFMKHPYFHKAVMQAYEQLIPAGEQPNYFIYFTLDPATIDVNIHPTKTEIKFENEQPIWQILMAATREALAKSSAIPTIDFDVEDAIDIPVYNPVKEAAPYKAPCVQVNSGYNPFETSSYKKPEFDWSKLYNDFEGDRNAIRQGAELTGSFLASDISEPTIEADEVVVQDTSGSLFNDVSNPCYQYKGKYIITSLKSGLALIDQHRAHVRILFDQYITNIRQQRGASQQVLFPEIVEFTASEATVLPTLLEDMRFIGFDLTNLGNNSYAINGLPAGVENLDPVSLIRNMVDRVIDTGCEVHEEICDSLALSLAKAAAIRPGKILSGEEMDNLLASLFSCQESNLTPDGKTIISKLTDEELEKRFK
ncbi:DNA mismatch repair endonuclease MutL [Parabacteroides merdae]|jgi:DNA mismatch repair protein MutL|uniref:DNA mismatch repair endonuclease MutL n=1 Tax=Parabacteroides merdae TaxID=46503 RepID=UPI0018A0B39A|nr:DNA mismatch repair endonuclease MutL [Parabacteroides merdae]MDB8915911.1 DNA mismatch repair endonuclease MutL [Parabacteroides merdae]MDB8923991.1 DNA mismatch repair endonuclease MutL [Parabacteroides merdae]